MTVSDNAIVLDEVESAVYYGADMAAKRSLEYKWLSMCFDMECVEVDIKDHLGNVLEGVVPTKLRKQKMVAAVVFTEGGLPYHWTIAPTCGRQIEEVLPEIVPFKVFRSEQVRYREYYLGTEQTRAAKRWLSSIVG